MRAFASPEEFSAFLGTRLAEVERGFTAELAMVGAIIGADARDRLGHYHSAEGPFPAWKQLAPYTQNRRELLGFSANDPLYMTGELQESISMTPSPWSVAVGVKRGIMSESGAEMGDIAVWQEFGAARLGVPWIPPRPFLGPSLYGNVLEALPMLSEAVVVRLTGLDTFAPRRFSRAPVTAMSEAVFAFGKAETGGV